MSPPSLKKSSSIIEKSDEIYVENRTQELAHDPDFEAKSDKLRRKLDMRFMPIMVLMFW